MKLLVSVRNLGEALAAAAHGADLIDLKEPHAGALGALPLADIDALVRALRPRHPALRLSATVGDRPAGGDEPAAAVLQRVMQRVMQTAACGVDDVKVGVGPDDAALLERLGTLAADGLPRGVQIVPVLIADDGVPHALVDRACALQFAAVMLDTLDKSRGSLVARRPAAELDGFVATVHAHGRLAGLAGSLRVADLPALHASGCDFAGFRSAVCGGDRRGALDASRVAALQLARQHADGLHCA